MAARINEVRDALAERVREIWGPTAPDEVVACHRVEIDSRKIAGRKVYVFGTAYGGYPVTRATNEYEYALSILVVEKFADPDGEAATEVTDEWIDERVAFVDALVVGLTDARAANLLTDEDDDSVGLWPQTYDVQAVLDTRELTEKKLFVSQLDITYREHEPAGG